MFVYSATGGLTQLRTTRAPRVLDSEYWENHSIPIPSIHVCVLGYRRTHSTPNHTSTSSPRLGVLGKSLNPNSINSFMCTRLPDDSLNSGLHEHLESLTRSHRENHSIPDICDHNHGRRSSRPSLDWGRTFRGHEPIHQTIMPSIPKIRKDATFRT